MAKSTQDKSATEAQFERFAETARALGCDEDKERFEAQLGKIAAHKPEREKPTAKKKREAKPKE